MAKQPHSIYERLRAIEDRLEIYNLIASHPVSADIGADYYSRAIYVEDGELDLGAGKGGKGNEKIASIVKTPDHRPQSRAGSRISPGCRISSSTATRPW